MATIIAMIAPMKTVPQNRGIEPNAPDDPAWSARIAVCGLHDRPKRKSPGGTNLKNRAISNSSDRTIPSVVKIAINEAIEAGRSSTALPPFAHGIPAALAQQDDPGGAECDEDGAIAPMEP